jgi:hypothetical protein
MKLQSDREGAKHLQKVMKQRDIQRRNEEPYTCSHFACGRTLTRSEYLAGTLCTEHMNTEKLNINLIIKQK